MQCDLAAQSDISVDEVAQQNIRLNSYDFFLLNYSTLFEFSQYWIIPAESKTLGNSTDFCHVLTENNSHSNCWNILDDTGIMRLRDIWTCAVLKNILLVATRSSGKNRRSPVPQDVILQNNIVKFTIFSKNAQDRLLFAWYNLLQHTVNFPEK